MRVCWWNAGGLSRAVRADHRWRGGGRTRGRIGCCARIRARTRWIAGVVGAAWRRARRCADVRVGADAVPERAWVRRTCIAGRTMRGGWTLCGHCVAALACRSWPAATCTCTCASGVRCRTR
jgi:hypothetical protein